MAVLRGRPSRLMLLHVLENIESEIYSGAYGKKNDSRCRSLSLFYEAYAHCTLFYTPFRTRKSSKKSKNQNLGPDKNHNKNSSVRGLAIGRSGTQQTCKTWQRLTRC